MHISSIYHRHIEHFFHIFGGSTVFSLISESTRRLQFLSLARMGELPPKGFMSNDGTGNRISLIDYSEKNKVYIPVTSFCEVYTSKSNNVVDLDKSTFAAAAFFYLN